MRYVFYIIIFFILTASSGSCLAFSQTVDKMYEELLKLEGGSNTSGQAKEAAPAHQADNAAPQAKLSHIQSVEEFAKQTDIAPERYPVSTDDRRWKDIIAAVATGYPSAFDIDYLKTLADRGVPDATELLAWMYAKGVGVKTDLKASWFLYMKAAELGVDNAKSNAGRIYEAMSAKEKKELLEY